MLEAGDAAPDFTLPNQDGAELKLSSLRGETVVLYFFPRADTPGCTTQACGVRDRGLGILRNTYVIDPDGRVSRVLPKVQPKKHDALVLAAIAELG